ncbi:uncharacterized protein LOC121430477 [Lytechinus variegatus]|uniref:uncharacterized protein LOC121430477 n=1 Tax=Lytechinus variegatus TaxID=7654 RepID=UPI001BB15658|nr:uncharacterized protein LOC121430477 [Lytechinus variegatus]XP_041483680.1 uncharacterized protein LOC121430477 [Lytechinus variegatus]
MSQAVGRMYQHPSASLRRAGDIPHIHPANAHRYNNYNNAVQVYTVTTRNTSPPHHRPFHNGGGGYGGGPPPSPPHHNPRGRRGGRYPPNSYYNSPPQQQPYHHPHQQQQQPYHHPHHHHQQHVQQQHHPQRQSPPPPPPQSQQHHHHHHNSSNSSSYYPKNQNQTGYNQTQRGSRGSGYYDDLEWDNYDLGSDKEKKAAQQRKRNERQDGWRRSGNGLMGNDFDLEWDDYDLRPKIEETDDGVELVLPENYLPLLKASNKATLSRGQIPISAIQVRRLPHRTFLSAKTLGFNKDLLVLTTDFPGLGDANETKELLEDALVDEREAFLLSQNNNGPEVCKLNGSSDKGSVSGSISDIPSRIEGSVTDSDSIRDRSQDLTDSDDQTTNDFLDDEYELPCHDRLADVNLYALSPHDFDSPDSIFSRSLADLTDLSLYEEFGVETIRRRRALLGGDKEGRDSLLKEATRKLSLKAKKRKRRTDKSGDGSVIGGGLDDGDDKKQKRVAPNYFVAIQVCSPEIHQALHNVQQTVMAGDEKLKDAMVPIPTLHLTIMVMHLATDEDVERAKLALMECHRLLGPEITRKKLNIWFHGLGHFNNQVMFAKIKDIDGILDTLYNVAETVENCYRRHGIHSTGERGFKPHLTVMKLSRAPSLRKKGVRRIKSELYRAHSATLFGNQPVSGFQLCSINKPKSEDGYYYKAHEVLFNQDVSPIPDPFDMTGMDDGSKEPITEPVSSTIIEEEPQEPIKEPHPSSNIEDVPKEPITEPVSSPVESSECQAANQTSDSKEAKEVSKSPDTEPQTSPNANTEGDTPSESAPT